MRQMDIELEIERIRDLVVECSFERGKYSLEKVAQMVTAFDATNWEQYSREYILRKKGQREQTLESLVKCPVCREPEKRRIVEKHGMCATCDQGIWEANARPCIFCNTMYVPNGMYGRKISVCESCEKFKLQVSSQNIRVRKFGLPCTLTVQQWAMTARFFHLKCAYCNGEFHNLEHYIPLALQGGTTQDNCVPSCNHCNNRKSNKSPEDFIPLFPTENIERIKNYFASLELSEVA